MCLRVSNAFDKSIYMLKGILLLSSLYVRRSISYVAVETVE